MSSIDEVIARSRQPGAFVERKRFAVERATAIRKMRQFALADPHYYALELIQSAVANGARSISYAVHDTSCTFSYVGGGYDMEELTQLFDFLFADKSDMAFSALRQLALGVNALMLMEPEEILIESGDGTVEGTTRVVIRTGQDVVDVGRPEHPLDGTFVRATKLDRRKIRGKSNLESTDYGPPETRAIEERCLSLPIPIMVNNRSVFGYSSVRSPTLFGYDKVIAIDEGDLYGTLGLASGANRHSASFKILTFGTWVQSMTHDMLNGESFGGIISYERLNKTADHAAIVRDLRFEELWARLMPYARRLLYGASEARRYEVRDLNRQVIPMKALVSLLGSHDFAVLIPEAVEVRSTQVERAMRIAEILGEGTPVLRVVEGDAARVRALSRRARCIEPDLSSDRDLSFLQKPQLVEPGHPWIISPTRCAPITVAELLQTMVARLEAYQGVASSMQEVQIEGKSETRRVTTMEGSKPEQLAPMLNARCVELEVTTVASSQPGSQEGYIQRVAVGTLQGASKEIEDGARHVLSARYALIGVLQATLHVPFRAYCEHDEILVRLISSGRLLWAGKLPCDHPGMVLSIELDGVMPRQLGDFMAFFKEYARCDERTGALPSNEIGELIAAAVLEQITPELERTSRRALASLRPEDVSPDLSSAQVCLGFLKRDAMLRVVNGEQGVGFELASLQPMPFELAPLPLFSALSGAPCSLAQLLSWLPSQGGLIYGALQGMHAQLEGLDPSRILSLTRSQEALLVTLFGASCYVRIDGRDTLALLTHPTMVVVRDMALGAVRATGSQEPSPEQALLSMPAMASVAPPAEVSPRERLLIDQLVKLMNTPPSADFGEEDLRRQALRHVQWFAIKRFFSRGETFGLERRGLFLDLYGRAISLVALFGASAERREVAMGDGLASDVLAEAGRLAHAPAVQQDEEVPALSMNPFVAVCLAEHVPVRRAFAFSLELERGEDAQVERLLAKSDFIVSEWLEEGGVSGLIGLPLVPPEAVSHVVVRERSGRCVALRGLADRLGVVGVMSVAQIDVETLSRCEQLLYASAQRLFERLIHQLPSPQEDPARWQRSVQVLLDFAAQHLSLVYSEDHGLRPQISHGLSRQILELPLFASIDTMPLSALALLRSYCADHGSAGEERWRARLSSELAPQWIAWLEGVLAPEGIVREGAPQRARQAPAREASVTAPTAPALDSWQEVLGRTMLRWISELRPDDEPLEEVRVSRVDQEERGWVPWSRDPYQDLFTFRYEQGRPVLGVNASHWLCERVERAHQEGGDVGEALMWVLLAAYAHLNALLEPVTNAHERTFQATLFAHYAQGALTLR